MRMLTDNLPWKFFSLVGAAALWWALPGESEIATSVPAAIQYRNVPPDLEVSAENFDRLFLKVRGPSSQLTPSELGQVALVLDLDEVNKPGEQTFTIGTSNLKLPVGVSLINAMPSQVRVRLERRVSKDVPVEVRFAGPPSRGYRVVGQQVTPQRLRIVGPESRIAQISSVQTDPVDLSSNVSATTTRVPACTPDPQVRFELQPPMVSVRVMLEKIPQGQL